MTIKISPPPQTVGHALDHKRKEVVNWLMSHHLQRSGLSCIVCGCTEDNPCTIQPEVLGGPGIHACSWVMPGLCSNPDCVAAFELETAVGPYEDEED